MKLAVLPANWLWKILSYTTEQVDEVAEWLRRWTANPMGSARVGSNPILVDNFFQGNILIFVRLHPNTGKHHMPPWRNRLARSAVNRKVGGSSPPGGAHFLTFYSITHRNNGKKF